MYLVVTFKGQDLFVLKCFLCVFSHSFQNSNLHKKRVSTTPSDSSSTFQSSTTLNSSYLGSNLTLDSGIQHSSSKQKYVKKNSKTPAKKTVPDDRKDKDKCDSFTSFFRFHRKTAIVLIVFLILW